MATPAGLGASTSTRRTVLGALLAMPVVPTAARWRGRLDRHAALVRPKGGGRSSGRCATCGAHDHSMLRCPATTKVI